VRLWRAALVVIFFASGCSQPMPEPGVLTVAMYASPTSLDPRYSIDALSSRAQQLMFNGLVRLDEKMAPAPDLAESWESTDLQTYRMHLHPGVRFHDGHELTSADVVYTFESILDPQSGSVLRGAFRNIKSVVAVDPRTVEFVLDAPAAAFLVNLVAAKIVPAGAGRELRERPVGTGPYQFVSYAVDDRLVVKAFPDYFGGQYWEASDLYQKHSPMFNVKGVTTPTLIEHGEPGLDHVVPADGSSEYARIIQGAKRQQLDRTGHLGSVTRPHDFADAIVRFVESTRNHSHDTAA